MSNHVIPLDDEREHEVALSCWCQPLEDGATIIHHALDCREKHERQGVPTGKRWAVIPDNSPTESPRPWTYDPLDEVW